MFYKMVFYNFSDVLVYSILYLFFYNLSLIVLFVFIWSTSFFYIKTLNNLKEFNNSTYKRYSILILLLSIAGVPPFTGFFFKVNLVSLIGTSSLYLLVLLFFFLFSTLFFYLQNIKYLLIPTSFNYYTSSLNDLKVNIFFLHSVVFILFFTTCGFLFLDDFFLIVSWLLF